MDALLYGGCFIVEEEMREARGDSHLWRASTQCKRKLQQPPAEMKRTQPAQPSKRQWMCTHLAALTMPTVSARNRRRWALL